MDKQYNKKKKKKNQNNESENDLTPLKKNGGTD